MINRNSNTNTGFDTRRLNMMIWILYFFHAQNSRHERDVFQRTKCLVSCLRYSGVMQLMFLQIRCPQASASIQALPESINGIELPSNLLSATNKNLNQDCSCTMYIIVTDIPVIDFGKDDHDLRLL